MDNKPLIADCLTENNVKELASETGNLAVSIYMPVSRIGSKTKENRSRLESLLREARMRLRGLGLKKEETESLAGQSRLFLNDPFFWRGQSNGLAIFLSAISARIFRLPLDFKETVACSRRFHLKPLFLLAIEGGKFYILALSKNRARFFLASRYGANEIKIAGLPQGIEDVDWSKDRERSIQAHGVARDRGGEIFHGQRTDTEDYKFRIRQYFRQINKKIRPFIAGENCPLAVAAADYEFSLYREAAGYPHIFERGIAGNPDKMDRAELHRKALKILKPFFQKPKAEAIKNYNDLAGTRRASYSLERIVPAAFYGRVDTLFSSLKETNWGRFEQNTDTVIFDEKERPGNYDLLDFALSNAFIHGAKIYLAEPDEMPNKETLAAILRY